MLFPDPWPKRRHWKRRLVSQGTLAELARVMPPGGELRIATDIADYAEWILLAVRRRRRTLLDGQGRRRLARRGAATGRRPVTKRGFARGPALQLLTFPRAWLPSP